MKIANHSASNPAETRRTGLTPDGIGRIVVVWRYLCHLSLNRPISPERQSKESVKKVRSLVEGLKRLFRKGSIFDQLSTFA